MNDRDFREMMRHYRREFVVTLPGGHHDVDDGTPDTRGYDYVLENDIPESHSFWSEDENMRIERVHMFDAEIVHADELAEILAKLGSVEDRLEYMDDFFHRRTGHELDLCMCDACMQDRDPIDDEMSCEMREYYRFVDQEAQEDQAAYTKKLTERRKLADSVVRTDGTFVAVDGSWALKTSRENLARIIEDDSREADDTDTEHEHLDLNPLENEPLRASISKAIVAEYMELNPKKSGTRRRLSQAKTSGLKQDHRRRPHVDLPMPASRLDN